MDDAASVAVVVLDAAAVPDNDVVVVAFPDVEDAAFDFGSVPEVVEEAALVHEDHRQTLNQL